MKTLRAWFVVLGLIPGALALAAGPSRLGGGCRDGAVCKPKRVEAQAASGQKALTVKTGAQLCLDGTAGQRCMVHDGARINTGQTGVEAASLKLSQTFEPTTCNPAAAGEIGWSASNGLRLCTGTAFQPINTSTTDEILEAGDWFTISANRCEFNQHSSTGVTCDWTTPSPTGLGNCNDATRKYACASTNTTVGNAAGNPGNSGGWTLWPWRPRIRGFIRTDADVSGDRYLMGMADGVPPQVSAAGGSSGTAFALAVSLNGGPWYCCAGDGSNYSCTAMANSAVASTAYRFAVDVGRTTPGVTTCVVNGIAGTHAGHLPSRTVFGVAPIQIVQTTDAVADTIAYGRWVLDQVDL